MSRGRHLLQTVSRFPILENFNQHPGFKILRNLLPTLHFSHFNVATTVFLFQKFSSAQNTFRQWDRLDILATLCCVVWCCKPRHNLTDDCFPQVVARVKILAILPILTKPDRRLLPSVSRRSQHPCNLANLDKT